MGELFGDVRGGEHEKEGDEPSRDVKSMEARGEVEGGAVGA